MKGEKILTVNNISKSKEVREKVIAIDGPSGSGKSTVAKKLAQSLGVLYVDTGAMFRALAYYFKKNNISVEDAQNKPELVSNFLHSLKIDYCPPDQGQRVLIRINGEDLTQIIREHHISTLASLYSQISIVRSFLLEFQRGLAQERYCVMEGRDIGTIVFPLSFCKIFLTADLNTRALRRLRELTDKGVQGLNIEQVRLDLKERDLADTEREVAPLKMAQDAHLIDTSGLSEKEVMDAIILEVKTSLNKWDMAISYI